VSWRLGELAASLPMRMKRRVLRIVRPAVGEPA
jgi:hypothetical protein